MNVAKPETLKHHTGELVKEFIEINESLSVSDDLKDAAYHFFGGRYYSDNTYEYQKLCVWALAAFAKPELQAMLKESLGGMYEEFISMLERLHDFAEAMDHPTNRAVYDLHHLENYATGKEPYLQTMFYGYAAKTAGLRAQREVKTQQDNYLNNKL